MNLCHHAALLKTIRYCFHLVHLLTTCHSNGDGGACSGWFREIWFFFFFMLLVGIVMKACQGCMGRRCEVWQSAGERTGGQNKQL